MYKHNLECLLGEYAKKIIGGFLFQNRCIVGFSAIKTLMLT